MDRRELLLELQQKHTPQDTQLVADIAAYLQHNYDPEVYALVESSFGMSFADLQNAVLNGYGSDFITTYKGECTWLRTYLELTSHNEAPGVFHALSALSVASVVIGRRTWIPMGFYDVFPPLGVILVGPSGSRKTVAISTATKMLGMLDHDVNIIRERFTPEALIMALCPSRKREDEPSNVTISDKTAFIVSPEMAVTFGKSHYLEGLVPLFTRLMDHEGYEGRTKGGGTYVLSNIALGFLGATTQEWITSEMSESVIQGGFTSRFLIAHARNSPRVIWRYTRTSTDRLMGLAEELSSLAKQCNGPMPIEKHADSFMEQWYAAHRLQGETDLGAGYHARKHVHILRLALIIAVLSGSRRIELNHIHEAISILDYLEPALLDLFRLLSSSQTARDASLIIDLVTRAGGKVTKAVLLHAAVQRMTLQRYNEACNYLREISVLREDRGTYKLSKRRGAAL